MTGPHFYDHSAKPHFVYRCYDANGQLVYIGCTVSPQNRMETHRTSSWWYYQVERTRFTVFPNKEHALAIERDAIGTERPRFNIKGRWASRAAWLADDYRDYYFAIVMSGNSSTAYLANHLKKVEREALHRFGINLSEVAA